MDNEQQWKDFSSSINKPLGYSPTKNLVTGTKSNIKCPATSVIDQLQKQKDGIVVDTGNQDHYKHLEASKNQTETPTAKRNILLVKDEPSVQHADAITADVPKTDTNEHVKETSAQNDDAITADVPKTDTNEHVKETSAQNDDAITADVPKTDASEHVKETSAQNDDVIFPEVPQTDGNESVNEESAQSDDAITLEVPKTDASEHVKEESAQRDDAINIIEEESQTNDIDKPSSSWTILNIAKYVNFDKCVIEIKMAPIDSLKLDFIYKEVKQAINILLKIVKGSDLKPKKGNSDSEFLKKLISITCIETGSRLVLDALLIPLCSALGLQLEVEKHINDKCLPSCRFDYCIRKGKRIIGCIEAKSVNGLSDKSIAQAILQLIVLQKTFIEKDNISKFPFFAIVTDGHQFIYIQLTGLHLGFEHDSGKLMIRTVKKMYDFNAILQHIMFLLKECDILID